MTTPSSPFQIIHTDCVGPLPTTLRGNRFIVTYIDAFSKWVEAYPVESISTDIVADTLADFISRHGSPTYIITDQGTNFMSEAMKIVYEGFDIKHIATSPLHPQGNGSIERFHRTLMNALSHIVNVNQSDWDTKLKFALLAIRTSVHDATKLTPTAVVYGRNLNLPYAIFNSSLIGNYNDSPSFCELLIPALHKVYADVHKSLIRAAEIQEQYRDKSAVVKDIKIGDLVWLFSPSIKQGQTRKLAKLNVGPFLVVEKVGNVNFKIASEHNLANWQIVHVDRLSRVVNRLDFGSDNKQSKDSNDSPCTEIDSTQLQPGPTPEQQEVFHHRRSRRFFYNHKNNQAPQLAGNRTRRVIPSGRLVNTRYDWR